MKRILTAATVAFLLLFSLCMSVYADPLDGSDTPTGTEYPTKTIQGNPFTPSGAGTVVNYATDGDGKEFYTITATDETVFYLVIDQQRSTKNVYFLNAVTVDDLMSLATPPKNGAVAPVSTSAPTESKQAETPTPAKQEQGGNSNTGMLIIIVVLAALGGGAAWYFKVYRPKQQGGSVEEYEPPIDEEEINIDGWDEEDTGGADEDAPVWDENESGADDE